MTIRQYAANGSKLDSHLYIYAASHQLIWQNDDADNTMNSRISIPVAAGMTYYAEATGHNASTGAYVLSFSTVATKPDTPGSFGKPTAITVNVDGSSKTSGTIDFTANSPTSLGDYDIYSYVATVTGGAMFRATPMSGNVQLHTYLYDSTQKLLA